MNANDPNQTAPSGEQPAETVIEQTVGEQPAFGSAEHIASLDPATLMEVLEQARNPNKPTPGQAPAATPATPTGEQPAAPAAPAAPAEADTNHDPNKPPQRVSLRSLPAEQQVQFAEAIDLVRQGKAATLGEAAALLAGTAPAQTTAAADPDATPTPVASQAPQVAPEVTAIQTKIDDLREQRDQAMLDYDRPKEVELNRQIEDANRELWRAEQAAESRKGHAQSYQVAYSDAVVAVEDKYPDLQDDNSTFSRLLDNKVLAARATNDPALTDPAHLVAFADELAKDLGILPAGQTPAVKPVVKPQGPPVRQSRPVGSSVAPGQTQDVAISIPDLKRRVESGEFTLEELQQVAFTR